MITRSQFIVRWCGILFGRWKEQDEIEVREVKIILLQERERGKGSGMRGGMEAMGECVLIAVSATLPASRSHEYISRPIPQINPSVHRDLDAIDSTVIFVLVNITYVVSNIFLGKRACCPENADSVVYFTLLFIELHVYVHIFF